MEELLWMALIAIVSGSLIILVVKQLDALRYDPLQAYPGPKLAAFTTLYKAYYEVIKRGGMVELLEKLHDTYGPVVRISPNELHFSDPHAFMDIYTPGSKFTKDAALYTSFGEDESSFGYIDPGQSKARRDILGPLFSRRAILKLENVIQEKADKLIVRVLSSQNKPINMSRAFRSMAVDIIASYCFAKCPDTLDAPEFNHPLLVAMENTPLMTWIFKYFPTIRSTIMRAPGWLPLHLSTQTQGFADLRKEIVAQIEHVLENPESLEHTDHEIIYHRLLAPQRNRSVPSRKSLEEEAQNLIFAGADTVGNTCALGVFYVLQDKNVLANLLEELNAAWPEKNSAAMGYETLERLPYLDAVIKESLRMSHGVVTALPRVVGPTDAVIAGNHVPAGTVVSIGHTSMHWNAKIFLGPLRFSPERWLQSNARELDNYLVPFSRGPRSCLGIKYGLTL